MAKGQLRPVLRYLRRAVGQAEHVGEADTLLEQFVLRQDEAAFAGLVDRYGPMVYGVCRRVLGDVHDAEDAFQATFLVLAKKAASIRQPGTLGGWLYRVACHLALEARCKSAKRRTLEQQLAASTASTVDAPVWQEARPWLDEELRRLPDKYLAPIRLHYLEGKTTEEAARELGWPKGTLLSRLGRGRDLLRERLTRRGVGLSSAATAALLGEDALAASPDLVEATTQAALSGTACSPAVNALVEGALNSMFYSKVRLATALLLLLALVAGSAGVLLHEALAADPKGVAAAAKPEPLTVGERGELDGIATGASLSRDGRYLAVHLTDPVKQRDVNGWKVNDVSIRVIDLATLKAIHTSPAPSGMTGLAMPGTTMGTQISPEGDLLVVPNLQIPKMQGGGLGLPGGSGGVGGFGGGGGFAGGGGLGGFGQQEFLVWDMAKKKARFKLPANTSGAHFAADGKTLVSINQAGDIQFWDSGTGKDKGSIKSGSKASNGFTFFNVSLDGQRAALLSYDLAGQQSLLRVWDLAGKKALASKKLNQRVAWSPGALSFAPDGRALAMAHGHVVKVWDVASGQDLFNLPMGEEDKVMIDSVLYSPDGGSLAVRSRGLTRVAGFGGGNGVPADCELVVFDVASRKEKFRVPGAAGVANYGYGGGLAFATDSKLLAVVQETGRGPQFGPFQVGYRVRLLDVATGKTVHDLPDQVTIIGFSPQDSYRSLLLTCSTWKHQPAQQGLPTSLPGKIKVWEIRGSQINAVE